MRGHHSASAASDAMYVRTVNPREPNHRRPLVVATDPEMGTLIELKRRDFPIVQHRAIFSDTVRIDNHWYQWIPWQDFHIAFPMLPDDTIIVCIDDLGLVNMLQRVYAVGFMHRNLCPPEFDHFQFSLSEEEREVDYRADAPRITTTQYRVLHAGFKRAKKRGRWYRIISAPKFLAASSLRDHRWTLYDLMKCGKTTAEFCYAAGVPLMASAGATAAKILRLPRYYPTPRRRVPTATNESARRSLRGHAYSLYIDPMQPVTAVEFDQTAAHPHAAASITMPSSDDLYAGLHFAGNLDDERLPVLWKDRARFKTEIQRHGLFYLQMYGPPRHLDNRFIPPQWNRDGGFRDFVTSNELEWLQEMNIGIEGIIARWTSSEVDTGITQYANDALEAVTGMPRGFDRAIIKAIFLAGLGVLGARPHTVKILRGHEITGGAEFTIPTRQGPLTVHRKALKRTYQLAIANLIQRTMIERECAKRSWQFARDLAADKWQPVCVYADSVFATPPSAQTELKILPEPWREKLTHTHLQFKTATTYVSDQASKMPGMPRFGGDQRQRARERWKVEAALSNAHT